MNYPDCIGPYVYRRGFDIKCEHELQRKGVGAYAFYEIEQPLYTKEGEKRTFEWAYAQTWGGDMYAAHKILDRAQRVGVAVMLNGGIIQHHKLSCLRIKQARTTHEKLVKKLIERGWQLDPKKLCDEGEMYRPAVY